MKLPKSKRRLEIGLKLKVLRESRLISQVELAKRLEISQAGLSKIERGLSSLNTEDFLQVLQIFNIPASHFYPEQTAGASEAILQNALTRLGAGHLYENASLPSEALEQAHQVIREVLVDGRNPRHITALAPVIVAQINQLHIPKLWAEFVAFGLERRLGWILENTLEAVQRSRKPSNLRTSRNYRQTETILHQFLGSIPAPASHTAQLRDVLGASTPTPKTLAALAQQSSPISEKWHILSPFQVRDFIDALKASHDAA